MKTKLVVVESPYAGDIERNTTYARRALRDCIQRGEAPIASHLLYTQPGILDEFDPSERALGIQLGYEWMQWADEVILYTDYGISRGMTAAEAHAKSLDLAITYRTIGVNP